MEATHTLHGSIADRAEGGGKVIPSDMHPMGTVPQIGTDYR